MIILVESGSTKSDWVMIQNGQPSPKVATMGFNPYFHDRETISQNIRKNKTIYNKASQVEALYFYGAGCSSKVLCDIIKVGLQDVFVHAEVHVGHDLEACAYSTYTGKPVIACILGTGSNSCYYDGKEVVEAVPALSYILGDEGSGSYYGKILLSKFLYNTLPAHIHKDFYDQYKVDKESILSNVYFKPNPNVYIASFAKFASRHKDDPFIIDMIREGMRRFMETHVKCYDFYATVEVNFMGSIAYCFQEILREVAQELNISVGTIIRSPIDGLVNYHMNFSSVEKLI
jgi:N-acetylglucosamine kinase-like BadF-type ATPase